MPQKNAADAGQVNEAGHKEKRGRDLELADVRFLLASPQGRRFIWRYLETCGMNKISFTGDPNWAVFNEGGRNVGLKLQADINEAEPEAYIKMLAEAKKGEQDA